MKMAGPPMARYYRTVAYISENQVGVFETRYFKKHGKPLTMIIIIPPPSGSCAARTPTTTTASPAAGGGVIQALRIIVCVGNH